MKENKMLFICSLLSLLLLTLHLTDDVVRGMFPPGIAGRAAIGAGHHARRFAHCGGNARQHTRSWRGVQGRIVLPRPR